MQSFNYPLIQQIYIEGLLWVRNFARYWRVNSKQNIQFMFPWVYSLVGEKNVIHIITQIKLSTDIITIKKMKDSFECLWGGHSIWSGRFFSKEVDWAEIWMSGVNQMERAGSCISDGRKSMKRSLGVRGAWWGRGTKTVKKAGWGLIENK